MNLKNAKVLPAIGLIVIVGILVASFLFVKDSRGKSSDITALKTENRDLKKEVSRSEIDYRNLEVQYNKLNKEKNGAADEALNKATQELFESVYNYDTSKKEDSVANRKEKAKEVATSEVLDTLFSKDADKLTPSVSTVSKLDHAPEVYRMSSDSERLTALVLINYSFNISGYKNQNNQFLYKISFEPEQKKITSIDMLTDSIKQ
ncbi:hypothetical protein ACQKTA_13450 (plasmid) [Enterococcus sp. 22-H-5-01]|uniref:hypothetical protein n=1 Tax=Enterococcus sp. 22-H-5-01 TaxID=3418555 RepID=UPI003D07F904